MWLVFRVCTKLFAFSKTQSQIKDSTIVVDTIFFNTQHYKVRKKGKGELSREKSSALSYNWAL